MSIFSDMAEDTIKVFMDDFSVVCDSSNYCYIHLGDVVKNFRECSLVVNWEKFYSMKK